MITRTFKLGPFALYTLSNDGAKIWGVVYTAGVFSIHLGSYAFGAGLV